MSEKPNDVQEAIELLKRSVKETVFLQRTSLLRAAIRKLDAHLKTNPTSDQREFIENVKFTHVRSHIEALRQVIDPDFDLWLANFVLFVVDVEPELKRVLLMRPALQQWHDSFRELYLAEIRQVFNRIQ